MTDGDALLRAILANPDDDTPRLVYADWLDENDQPARAEFIRVQIELARNPSLAVMAREAVLLAQHEEKWLAPFKARGEPLNGEAHGKFRRGFVGIVWMSATTFIARAQSLFARMPVLELRVTQTTPLEFEDLLRSPFLARLEALDLSERRLGNGAVIGLASAVFAQGLVVLRLRGCGITDVGAHFLASTTFDRPLRELDVSHNPISPDGVAALRKRYGNEVVRAEGMLPIG